MKPTGADIRAAVAHWQKVLSLTDWQIRVTIGRISGGHRATCECDWAYREADLRFDPTQMAKHKDDVREVALHEVVHILCWRSNEAAQKRARNGIDEDNLCVLEETETTDLTHRLLKLRLK